MRISGSWWSCWCVRGGTESIDMPTTDLVMLTIPTYNNARPVRTKEIIYLQREIQWQRENIPKLLKAGVISYCDSPLSAQTKHPLKKDGNLRLVTILCPINRATIKSNYPIKRIQPILNMLSQEEYRRGPKSQAAMNGYYRTAWRQYGTVLLHYDGSSKGYREHLIPIRLKDIAMGIIPEPNAEP